MDVSLPVATVATGIRPPVGVGIGDMMEAMREEIERIIKETKGNPLAETKLLYRRLHEMGLLEEREVETLSKLAQHSFEANAGKKSAQEAYFHARASYNGMIASGKATPLALVLASSSVGSYTVSANPDGSGTVVYAKSGSDWEHRGAAAGAIIGGIWGPEGALVGGAIGGLVGAAVDHCTK